MLNQITKTNQTLMVFQTNTTLNFKPELSCMYIEQILTALQVDLCHTRLINLGKQADFISEHHEVQPSLRFLITTRYILTKSSLVPPDAKQEQNISLIQLFSALISQTWSAPRRSPRVASPTPRSSPVCSSSPRCSQQSIFLSLPWVVGSVQHNK